MYLNLRQKYIISLVFGIITSSFSAVVMAGGISDYIERTINNLMASSIDLSLNNAGGDNFPSPPITYLSSTYYDESTVTLRNGEESLRFRSRNISAATGLPLVVSDRDIIAVAGYVMHTEFDLDHDTAEDFSATSLGVPVGWLHQIEPHLQVAGFVFPLLHSSNLESGTTSWQTMAGLFTRYVQSDQLWWAFGVFADVAEEGSLYLPYVGASWAINRHWQLNALLPWPNISYAPNEQWLFNLGARPSGASWSLDVADGQVAANLDAWDFGLTAARRISEILWLDVQLGIGSMRSYRLADSSGNEYSSPVDSNPYISIALNVRIPSQQ